MQAKPVVIIGAPRSGTNMLRDVLTGLDGIATWPCDEINYIWRHGNVFWPTDEIPPERATPRVRAYIRNAFDLIARRYSARYVVEKTCASALRVPFVREVLPEAKFLYIYRDGLDVVGSAELRWKAELDIPYLLRKVRFVPWIDLPYYGFRYFWNRLYRLFSRQKALATWGPRFPGMDELARSKSVSEVCAAQWQRCVDRAEAGLADLDDSQVLRLRYEDFVARPAAELGRCLEFLGYQAETGQLEAVTAGVSARSVGKGRSGLEARGLLDEVRMVIASGLKRYGYD